MEDDSYYLIKVKGGCDWDKEDDGVIDTNCTQNKGTIRAIAKGQDIKAIGENFKVTLVSELIFEKVAKHLYNNFNQTTFETKLTKAIKEVIASDIDGNGVIDVNDMATFEPIDNKDKLTNIYKTKFQDLVEIVHTGKLPLLNINYKIGHFNTDGYAQGVSLSKDGTKAYIADGYNGLVVLDITDPSNPTQLERLDTEDYAYDVTLSKDGSKAYIADGGNGLVILDISPLKDY